MPSRDAPSSVTSLIFTRRHIEIQQPSSVALQWSQHHGPPGSEAICISVDEEIAHGIPGKRRTIAGDPR